MAMTDEIILFVGPRGTSEERAAALLKTAAHAPAYPVGSVTEVLQTVEVTPGALGLLAWENPLEGELTAVLDRLAFETTNVVIRETVVLAETIGAWGRVPEPQVHGAISHPLVLSMCRSYIASHALDTVVAESTKAACEIVAEGNDDGLVALAPECVAQEAGLCQITARATDVPEIRTRYALLSQHIWERTGDDQTMIVVTPPKDAPGALSAILREISSRNIDMTSIHSRPILQGDQSAHCFYLELAGHVSDPPLAEALASLEAAGCTGRVLGSYPRWSGTPVDVPFQGAPQGRLTGASLRGSLASTGLI